MTSARDTAGLGSKIGPRIAKVVSDAMVDNKRRLADTDRRIRTASMRDFIDAAGFEISDLSSVILAPVLTSEDIPADVRAMFGRAVSGRHQWLSMIVGAGASVALGGGLSALFSNLFAKPVRGYNSLNPNLQPDVGTVAQLDAKGLIGHSAGTFAARGDGFDATWYDRLVGLNAQYPSPETIIQLVQRGYITENTAENWLNVQGVQPGVSASFLRLQRTLLSPADAALAEVRGHLPHKAAAGIAEEAGITGHDYGVLRDNTAQPLTLTAVVELWRRGAVSEADLERAIHESTVDDSWTDAIKQLGIVPPSPDIALQAYLEGQVPEAEARRRYKEGGGDPSWFDSDYDTRGSAPSPVELGDMANRGIIPWNGQGPKATTFQQGFLEGPWRNKWRGPMRKLAEYLPPPRTVTAMYHEGSLTRKEANDLLVKQGLTAHLAAAYTQSGSNQKTAGQRDLAVSTIMDLYRDQAIGKQDAKGFLTDLGYDGDEADFILLVSDLRRVQRYTETAIRTIHTQYTNHSITQLNASDKLDHLGVPSGQRDQLLQLWDLERQARVETLTATQIRQAFEHDLISRDDAVQRLVNKGYSRGDAGIFVQL